MAANARNQTYRDLGYSDTKVSNKIERLCLYETYTRQDARWCSYTARFISEVKGKSQNTDGAFQKMTR